MAQFPTSFSTLLLSHDVCKKRLHIAPKYPVPEPRLYIYFRHTFEEYGEPALMEQRFHVKGFTFTIIVHLHNSPLKQAYSDFIKKFQFKGVKNLS